VAVLWIEVSILGVRSICRRFKAKGLWIENTESLKRLRLDAESQRMRKGAMLIHQGKKILSCHCK
jgi:hypothetical protein